MWSVFFVFLSYLDRDLVRADVLNRAVDAEKENKETFSSLGGIFCAKMLTDGGNFLYQVSDGVEIVESVVSPSGMVVNCSVLVNQTQVKSFVHECKLGLRVQKAAQQLDARFAHMEEARVTCRELKQNTKRSGRAEGGDSDDPERVFKRSKRGFTYPGTLWCGAGNTADHYDQLGEFTETDSCCRIHDHCPHVIHAFSSKFGYTNFKWHSISHCDCDEKLKACLRRVNDTSSRVVGQAFFNVIGVPCFDFAYEEQCAERHWYGLCKRYEKFPTAVLKTAVPYDYGGIAIIDELPLPSSKKANEKKEEKEDNASKTQSTISGPEEPLLRNVVTAAEDFIKVLATVSTSQSSTASSDRGQTQGSEKKKKRKNTGKKKTGKKQKGKGKWRKNKKQKAELGGNAEEGAAASASGSKGEVKGVSTFAGHDPSGKHSITEYEPVRKEEPVNEVMKDEPTVEKETVSVTSTPATGRKPETTTLILCPTTVTSRRKRTKQLKQRGKTVPYPKEPPLNATDISVTTTRESHPQQQSLQSIRRDSGNQPGVGAAKAPTLGHEVKRSRSRESADREWREKRRKDSSASPTEPTPNESKPADHLKAIPHREAPAVDRNEGRTIVPDVPWNTSFSVLKTQKLKEKALRSSGRKAAPKAAAGGKPSQAEANLLSPPPQMSESGHVSISATSTPTVETQARTERLSPATKAPTVTKNRHRQTIRKQRRSRNRIGASAVSGGVSVFNQSGQPAARSTFTPPDTATTTTATTTAAGEADLQQSDKITASTSAGPILTPLQVSVERLKAQFNRKKRRKMAMRRQ